MIRSGQDGQILVLSALVLVVVAFLMALVTGVAQLNAAHAQMEKAAVLSGRSGALRLGALLVNGVSDPNLASIQAEVVSYVQTVAQINGAAEVQVAFNNAAELEVKASRDVELFFGMPPSQLVTATVTVQVIPREDAGR